MSKAIQISFTIFILLCACTHGMCQPEMVKRSYTIADGLPSNHVYKCLQDKKGFIWVATDNGLSRFDGHHFTNFSIKDGLPDSDILDIFLDSAGNIWMIPFGKYPAYFNTITNKIINSNIAPDLAKIKGKSILLGHAIYNGDVVFYDNDQSAFVFGNNTLRAVYNLHTKGLSYFTKNNEGELAINPEKYFSFTNGQLQSQKNANLTYMSFVRTAEENKNLLFLRSDSSIIQISNFDKNLSPIILIKKNPFRIWNINYLKEYIGAAARNGIIYFFNKQTLEIQKQVQTGKDVKNISEDNEGNFWIATQNNGIIKLSNLLIKSVVAIMDEEILSLHVDKTGLIAGTINGDILSYKKSVFNKTNLLPKKNNYNNITAKKIISVHNETYIISFSGLFKQTNNGYEQIGDIYGFKDGLLLNDSILIIGTHSALYKYNTYTKLFTKLINHRSNCVTSDNLENIYFGSNDGLYKWNNKKLFFCGENENMFSNNITQLYTTPDNIVWVALSSDTLVAMKNDAILLKLSIGDIANGSGCKALASNAPGVLWVGTDRSLVKIIYKTAGNRMTFTSLPFSKTDGLSEGQINDIAFYGDTVFVATTSGICKFNKNISPTIHEVPIYITQIKVNSNQINVKEYLDLTPEENNVQIKFSAIELSGVTPQIQYKVNNKNWQNIDENLLTLTGLAPGNYTILVRALKINKEPSNLNASLNIKINRPFWATPFFIFAIILFLFIAAMYLINKSKLMKQQRAYKQQLALQQQRLKITADLHDDIGASLSSLQVNSAVANMLVDAQPQQAKEVLDKIEEQSKRLSENIGDIIWSMKPGKDEFMTMSSRIKTFASDILGATNIDYTIHIDKEADTKITDFTTRKNIVLIIKEAINNAVKYSQATTIKIELKIAETIASIAVQDNGIGMDADSQKGNGLQNMKKRTEELGGIFDIKSGKGIGVTIIAKIPL